MLRGRACLVRERRGGAGSSPRPSCMYVKYDGGLPAGCEWGGVCVFACVCLPSIHHRTWVSPAWVCGCEGVCVCCVYAG